MAFQYAEAQRKGAYPPTPKAKPIPRPTIPMAASQTQKPLGAIPQRTPTMLGGAIPGPTKPQMGATPVPFNPASQGMAAATNYATPGVTPKEITFGQNVTGFNAAQDAQLQLAKNGVAWNAATTKAERDAIHTKSMQIGTGAGGTYDAKMGTWAFPTEQIADKSMDIPAAAATPAPMFTAPTPTQQIPTASPAIPVMNEAAIKEYAAGQLAAKLAKLRQSADQSIAAGRLTADRQLTGLQTGFDRQRANITEDRSLANTAFDRTYSPFSGGTEEKRFQRDFGRERTDREMNADNLSRQANVQQDAANLEQTINEKYAMMQQLAPDEQAAMEQSIRNDERNYDLMLRGELRSDTLANSQINDTQFNQSLAGYNARRSAFEDQRNFDYGQYSDQVNWTGNIPGGGVAQGAGAQGFAAQGGGGQAPGAQGAPMRTLAGQAQDFNQQQQGWENRFNYGQATGQFANGQKTLEKMLADRNYDYQVGRDKVGDTRWQNEFDQRVTQDGLQNAVSWYNAKTSSSSAGNAAGTASFNKLKDIWAATGKAPDGLQAWGVQPGDAYKPDSSRGGKPVPYDSTPAWSDEITALNKDPQGQYDDYIKNSQEYIAEYTYDGYLKLLQQAGTLLGK